MNSVRRLTRQIKLMKRNFSWRLKLHFVALIIELVAAVLIFLEAARFDAMSKILGNASFAGEPEKYHSWYYHSGAKGFCLLVMAILISGFSLFLEHYEKDSNTSAK
jgi:hypothetical protein